VRGRSPDCEGDDDDEDHLLDSFVFFRCFGRLNEDDVGSRNTPPHHTTDKLDISLTGLYPVDSEGYKRWGVCSGDVKITGRSLELQ
jgi:hypothetical protein